MFEAGEVSVTSEAGKLDVAVEEGSTGVVNIGGEVGSAAKKAGSLEAKLLQFGDGDGSLNFNHTNTDYVFDTRIAGPGQLNQIAGTTILTGKSNYDKTTINGGTLIFANGGQVDNNEGLIGSKADSSGKAIVSGAGSSWSSSDLTVGEFGTGILTVSNAGQVLVNNEAGVLHVAKEQDSSGAVNIGGAVGSRAQAAGSLEVKKLRFGDGAGSLNFNHTNTDYVFGTRIAGPGQVNQIAGTTVLTGKSSYDKTVINGGALFFAQGANVDNNEGIIGNALGLIGEATVTGDGSIWTVEYDLFIGKSGAGRLTVMNKGRVNVSDGLMSRKLYVGEKKDGVLTIKNGGVVHSQNGEIGYQQGSSGEATVSGADAVWENYYYLIVGTQGKGRLIVSAGGTVNNGFVGAIGNQPGSSGKAVVTGPGSSWKNKDHLIVGEYGTGRLSVKNGGKVSSSPGSIGCEKASRGQAVVSGLDSSWSTGEGLIVGEFGTGILTVSNEGNVSVNNGAGVVDVAKEQDSFGSVNIGAAEGCPAAAGSLEAAELRFGAGKGSLNFNHTDADYVFDTQINGPGDVNQIAGETTLTGKSSYNITTINGGTLVFANGAEVSNTSGIIGRASQSSGNVLVSGARSTWDNSDMLFVGYRGQGVLTVLDGANVSVGEKWIQVASNEGSIGVVNIGAAAGSPAQEAGSLQAKKLLFGAGEGSLNFNHTNTDYVFSTWIVGPGQVNQIAGTTILTGANDYTGATNIAQGTLQAGARNVLSAASAHSVAAGATLNLAGFDQTLASLRNSGTVRLSSATANSDFKGTTLKITGPYVGNDGHLAMSTQLDDSSSASDRLLFSGATAVASGNTTLQITNVGGLGAQTTGNGIEIISTENGARIMPGAFTLAGEHVDAGAFEYRLAQTAQGAYLHSSTEVPSNITTESVNSAGIPPVATLFAATLPKVTAPVIAASVAKSRGKTLPVVTSSAVKAAVVTPPATTSLEKTPPIVTPAAADSSVATLSTATPVTLSEETPVVTPPAEIPTTESSVALTSAAEVLSAEPTPDAAPEDAGPLAVASVPTYPPAYRAEVPLLSALPAQLRQADMAMLGDMHQRQGDEVSGSDRRRSWGRILRTDPRIRQQGTVSPQSSGHLTGFQAGIDLYATPSVKVGLYVGELKGNMSVNGFASGIENKAVGYNHLQSRYLGVYGSWQDDAGLHADAVLQAADYRSSLQTDNKTASTKGSGWLASLEVGKPIALSSHWQVEPQAQLIYRQISLDDTVLSGATVQHTTPSDWTLRLGARIKGSLTTAAGVLEPYGRINVYKASVTEDLARFSTPVATTDIAAQGGYMSTALAAGATLQLNQRTSVYGEMGQYWANGGDTRVKSGLQASLGMKVRW